MADSRQYRKKYYINSGISLVLLLAVLSMLSITADETSGDTPASSRTKKRRIGGDNPGGGRGDSVWA